MNKIKLSKEPVILKNKDFQTIQIKLFFPYTEEIKDLAKIVLLPNMLNYMNNKYPSDDIFQTEKKKLYILGISCSQVNIGTTGAFVFTLNIPNTKILNEDLLEEQFEFFENFIYNPLVNDNSFTDFELDREIKNLKMSLDNAVKNVKSYHNIKLKKVIDSEGIFSRNIIDYMNLIDDINGKILYDYYLKTIKNNRPIIYVMGDVNKRTITSLCNKYLYKKEFENDHYNGDLYYFLKPRKSVNEVVEKSSFSDSVLSFVYKVKDMNQEDYIYLNAIRDLLTSLSSRILNTKLRDENDLVYSSRVVSFTRFGVLEITAYLNNKHYYEVKIILNNILDELKNIKKIRPLLNNIKERKKLNLLRKLDNKYLIFEDFIVSDLGVDVTTEEYYDKFNNISAEDISKFIDRLTLDTIYYLQEGEDE